MPNAVICFVAVMLLAGILPLPYGYYMLLRLVACGVFGFAGYITYQRQRKLLPWLFVFVSLLYNPVFKIHFPKDVWMVIDFVSALALFITRRKFQTNELNP